MHTAVGAFEVDYLDDLLRKIREIDAAVRFDKDCSASITQFFQQKGGVLLNKRLSAGEFDETAAVFGNKIDNFVQSLLLPRFVVRVPRIAIGAA